MIDRALYPPRGWADDRARCTHAGVPEKTAFTTEPKLARLMPARAFEAGVPCTFVAGDGVYGSDYALRRFIEARGKGDVPEVTSAQHLGLKGRRRLSAGDGAKGPRLYGWAYLPYRSDARAGRQKGLLIRRKIAEPDEVTFYLTPAPATMARADPVRVAGARRTVEACFEAARGEVGSDEDEARSWTGWHRHITLAMLAHAYLTVIRKSAIGGARRARSRGRAAAPHRARGAPPGRPLWHLVWAGAPAHSRGRARPLARGFWRGQLGHGQLGMVNLAKTPPAARTTMPLETTHQSS